MIWGEIINSVRSLHLNLIRNFKIQPLTLSKDIELDYEEFPFPEAEDDYDEWDEADLGAELQDVIPLHPVERVLLEGPILPIQKVNFNTKSEIDVLFAAILNLEIQWCEKMKVLTPSIREFIEQACVASALKYATQLGFQKLTRV